LSHATAASEPTLSRRSTPRGELLTFSVPIWTQINETATAQLRRMVADSYVMNSGKYNASGRKYYYIWNDSFVLLICQPRVTPVWFSQSQSLGKKLNRFCYMSDLAIVQAYIDGDN